MPNSGHTLTGPTYFLRLKLADFLIFPNSCFAWDIFPGPQLSRDIFFDLPVLIYLTSLWIALVVWAGPVSTVRIVPNAL